MDSPMRIGPALAYRETGEFGRSVADLTKAISLEPKNGQLYADRGRVYEKVGQQSKATRDYEKAKTLGYKSGQSKNAVSL